MVKGLKRMFQGKGRESGSSEVKVDRANGFHDFDGKVEAMAVAEAGAVDLAREMVSEGQLERPAILVVGKEDVFSEPVADYAISLAERLGCDIVAMNVSTVMGHSGRFLSPFKSHLREEFEKRSAESVDILRERASARGIECRHVVKFGDLSKAVEELHQEVRRVEFVITEPETHPDEAEAGAEVTIPVFTVHH